MTDDIVHDDFTITRNGKRYGCHCDTGSDQDIDGCVIDTSNADDCIHGRYKNGQVRSTQWTCEYWRPMPTKEAWRRSK